MCTTNQREADECPAVQLVQRGEVSLADQTSAFRDVGLVDFCQPMKLNVTDGSLVAWGSILFMHVVTGFLEPLEGDSGDLAEHLGVALSQ